MGKPTEGLIQIKNGKVKMLKNISEMKAAHLADGDPIQVLKTLSEAGWKIDGDYDLRLINDRQSEIVTGGLSAPPAVEIAGKKKS